MIDLGIYQPFAIALGLGLLVGLQRQWHQSDLAGIRTFPLIALAGAVAGTLDGGQPYWVTAAGLLAMAIVLIIGNWAKLRRRTDNATGMTTETAVLLMYLVGAILAAGYTGPAIVIAGVTAVLLQWKRRLHEMVGRFSESDLRGLFVLVLIALVILPLLPNRTIGPYDVLNPFKIWLMVVLIVGISLAAYIAYRLLGASVGAVLGGVLGGLISSTATTVSFARQAKHDRRLAAVATLVIVIASTIVNVRVLFEIGVISRKLLSVATLPLLIMLALMIVESLVLFFLVRRQVVSPPKQDNPAQLRVAIIFGALYAVILFIVAWAREQFGSEALYVVAAISGLTDVDAMTLSTAQLFNEGRVAGRVAWRVIVIATLSNLIFKTAAVWILGSRRLALYVTLALGIALMGGIGLVLLWPDVEIKLPIS